MNKLILINFPGYADFYPLKSILLRDVKLVKEIKHCYLINFVNCGCLNYMKAAFISVFVYSFTGDDRTASVRPSSTFSPFFITITP